MGGGGCLLRENCLIKNLHFAPQSGDRTLVGYVFKLF